MNDPDMCCYLRKVEPLQRAFKDVDVWISGIRRDQTRARRSIRMLDYHEPLDVVKVSPMANVTSKLLDRLNDRLDLPRHPLLTRGYRSIGCAPCTKPTTSSEESRAGRWAGKEKTECGLHFDPKTGEVARNMNK